MWAGVPGQTAALQRKIEALEQQLEAERQRADFSEREFRDMAETLQNAIKVWRVDDKLKGVGGDNVDEVIIQYVAYLHNELASLRTMARWLDTRE